ncbi:MAG: hypothetical protein DCC66_07710 [Planctomycetota bacterium]|nr:MAG: hypothetical protein DCC66_07710 [Planctomycetota bacterium]
MYFNKRKGSIMNSFHAKMNRVDRFVSSRAAFAALVAASWLIAPASARADSFVPDVIVVDANSAVTGAFNAVAVGPTITESFFNEWPAGTTITLTAPTHFVFDTSVLYNAVVIAGDVMLANAGAETPAANSVTFTVTAGSTIASTIRFPDIRLRAVDCTGGTAGPAADILLTVSAAGSTLVNVPIVDVSVIAGPAVDHFTVSAVPATLNQAAGSPFVVTLTARDLCNNILPNFVPPAPITIAAAGGAGLRTFASGGAANALTIVDNANNTATVPVATPFDALGTGSFEVASPVGEGPITITAALGAATGNIAVNWIDATCSLAPPADTNAINTMHSVTVTVLSNGAAAAGVNINFDVTAGPNVGAAGVVATDGAGQATFTYNGAGGPGTDTIQASGLINGVPFVCNATKTWIDPVCVLTPPADTNLIGSDHTVTSTVLVNGAFAAGVTVNYLVTAGPNAGAAGMDTTDALGVADFTYTSNGTIGVDTIQASGVISGVPFTCTATKEWINTGCSLAPATDVNRVGDMHTVTITVLRNGIPPLFPPGVNIDFEVVSGPNVGTVGMATTDAAGNASFTYTSNGNPGLDTIRATGLVDSVPILCTATKDWIDPTCTLTPPAATNLIGTMHAVTATVLRRPGVPAVGATVNFAVTAGPNAGTVGAVVTNAAGEAVFMYTDAGGPGVDTIQASGNVDGVTWTTASAAKTWISTGCSLAPASDTNQIGDSHTVTATVLRNGLPAAGITVNFLVTAGPNTGTAGVGLTDVNGNTSFTYNGVGGVGIDTITATGSIDGVPWTPATATKEWIDAGCILAPASDTNQVGDNHSVTVTVVRNGVLANGVTVNFLVTAGPNAGAAGVGVTNVIGEAVFNYTSNGLPGTDTIQATALVSGVATVCTASKTWINAQCLLDPAAGVNLVGTSHTVTSTVLVNGVPQAGVTVNFSITAGPNAGQNGADVTDALGHAEFTYMSNGAAGTDTIAATATITGVTTNCSATKEWITSGCSLDPPTAANGVGTMHTVTVTVLRNGGPAAGVNVGFSVINGPNFGASLAAAPTNALGQRSFTYTSNGATGTDTIEASGLLDGIPFSCTATKTWVQASCSLSPPTATNQVGTNHLVTVTVLRNGAPAAGATVNFNITAGPNTGLSASPVTNGAGQATFNYVSNGTPGTDTIQASGNVDGSPFVCTVTKTWINTGCSLSPPTDTNQIGTQHTVTANVLNNGVAAPGVLVTFEVTAGPNTGDTGLAVTNASGNAVFTYTGDGGPGTDTIQASGAISGVPFTCTATKSWINAACSLAPPTATNQVGTDHSVTVTVTSNGAPQNGVLVAFDVSAGPNAGAGDLRFTNAAGQATFTYTSNGQPGTDTITAGGLISGVPFTCTASKTWINAQCSLSPPTDTNVNGEEHTTTVTVTRNGAPVAGVVVNFNITSGPNAGLNNTDTTDASGQGEFIYTGAGGAGTDTIQATGNIDGVPFTCTATKTWQAGDGNGINPDEEDGAPNNGDGNNDGIPDKLQPNVASLKDINGNYVTIVSPPGTVLMNVEALNTPAEGITPPDVTFPVGFFGFKVTGIGPGDSIEVQIIMHSNPTVNTYYKFGPTPIIPVPHFYTFLFDGNTGSEVAGNVVTLHLTDGQRGDNDLTVNGIIVEPGAPALQSDNPAPLQNNTCGVCGSGAAIASPLLVVGLAMMRRGRSRRRI